MQVRDAMSKAVLTVGPEHTLRQTAQLMSSRRVGAAIVIDPDGAGVGIITERDVLNALADGQDPDVERAAAHITWDVVYAGPSWTLEDAAAAMIEGSFRHLVVMSDDEVLGVISVRDIVRVWAQHRSTVPA
ncbi:CBS domain-containing protein [Planosporangium flavigriseum]|uniref:Histidine kinase n=1 Tax=Planosporangium flavigriseum TaxID=373681 RepID=A0A8J3LEI3_9ACTN|nr:CBS domain-containing protein [Planosporangium flavigriseum]NJC64554.1 CBS domain-containing protein [Planosporangium flavigriseum]GIG71963.1 histidine kinase [Planosporangium flavigriseum]